MKVAGIIVEYNPLHNGHIHHIEETRRLSGADVLIAVMSGNVVQRGEFSAFDKFTKTKWALKSGIDLVVELPGVFTIQNADIFAYTSVSILSMLGVDTIYFGSESGDANTLKVCAEIMRTDAYDEKIREFLKEGHSYPSSADKALASLTSSDIHKNPNDILGIQYINAVHRINPAIHIDCIRRIESGYYSPYDAKKKIQSATAIRKRIKAGEPVREALPEHVANDTGGFLDYQAAFPYIRYNLSVQTSASLKRIFGFEEGLENYLIKHHDKTSFNALLKALGTRRYTNAKIKRSLMFMLLNVEKSELQDFNIPYLRILGMNETGQRHINAIKRDLDVPLITKIKRERHPYLDIELRISRLYDLLSGTELFSREFKPVIIL